MNGAKQIATRLAWSASLASVLSLMPALGAHAALLVGNTRANNIVMIDEKTGAYLGDFIAAGSGGLSDPDDVTLGPDGKVYVSSGNTTTGGILRYSSSGAFIDTFATSTSLKRPYGNAFGPDGNLYVASFRSDQILRYNGSTGAFIDVFAQGNGTSAGLLNGPNDLTFSPDGTMLFVTTQGSVADGLGGISYQFDSQLLGYSLATGTGHVVATPSPTAGGNGYVSLLGAVFAPDGLLYTTDYAGGIRSYSTLTGALVQTIDTGALFGGSIATTLGNLVFAPDGTLYMPVFNEGANGVEANGVAACAVATGSCALLVSDSTHLSRPIGAAYVPTPVPEPSAFALMLIGFGSLFAWRRRTARRA